MFRLINSEFKKIGLPVVAAIVVLSVAASVLSCTLYKNYALFYDLEAWEVGYEVLNFLFPLFVVIPICWSIYYERKNNYLLYTLPRVGKRRYLTSKWIAAGISAFAIVFIPWFTSALFALYVKPPITPWMGTFNHVFSQLFVETPLVYALLLSLWKGVLGVLVMSLGFVLSLYVNNIFIILTGPFIYSIVENFTWAVLGKPQYRLVVSFEPTAVVPERITPFSMLVGPALLVAVIALVWFVAAKVKKQSVYQI